MQINLNIFRTYLLFIHTFSRTLKHHQIILNSLVKVENALLKRAVALQRSYKSLLTSEESRGDLIPLFSEIANLVLVLVLVRCRDNRKLSGGFIYRSDNRYRACCIYLSFNHVVEFCRGRRGFTLSTVCPRERTRREHGGRKFRVVVTRKIAQGSSRIIPLCSRHIDMREVRWIPYNVPFYFTVRYLRSYAPSSSLFLSLLYSLYWGSCTSYCVSRIPFSIIDCLDTRKERPLKDPRRKATALPRDIPASLGRNANPLAKGRHSLSAQLRLLLWLLVGVEFVFLERSETRSVVECQQCDILYSFRVRDGTGSPPPARFVHPLRASALTRHDDGFHERRLGLKGDIVPSLEMYRFIKFRRRKIFRITVSQRRNFQSQIYSRRIFRYSTKEFST